MNIITHTNMILREQELQDTYEVFKNEYIPGYSLRHKLTKQEINLVFESKSALELYAQRNNLTLL